MRSRWQHVGTACLVLLSTGLLMGAGPRPLERELDSGDTAALTNAPLKEIAAGIFELGGVRLDKNKRAISFPSEVNMRQGPTEYLLVHTTGKLHESVLMTETAPYHIHLALLLISPKQTNAAPSAETPVELRGPTVRIQLEWSAGDETKQVPGEDLVFNTQTKASASRGPWVYNGSRLVNGVFLAQRDGSIISMIADPDALVNSPRPGREDDDLWQANTSAIPPAGTPVRVTIQLEEAR